MPRHDRRIVNIQFQIFLTERKKRHWTDRQTDSQTDRQDAI